MEDYSMDPLAKSARKSTIAIQTGENRRQPSIYAHVGRRASVYPQARRRSSAISQVIIEGDYVVNNNTYRRKSLADVPGPALRTGKDEETILIPQPSDHPDDPLNWSWGKKHCLLLALTMGSLLTDWGMTWGTTLYVPVLISDLGYVPIIITDYKIFEAQAAEWHMSVPSVANSISGGIFLQGAGGVLAVPLVQRYGRLPILFWSQLLSCAMCIGAALAPSYAGFTACRTLQGFFNTAPQIIGLSMINDIFFFHERTRKINIWAWSFLCGPFIGPLCSGLLVTKLTWRNDFLVLAGLYGFSSAMVAFFGDETLFDRDFVEVLERREKGYMARFKLLIGVQGVKDAAHRPNLWSVTKHMLQIATLPYLLLPTAIFILLVTMWTIGINTSITQFVKPPPYLFSDINVALLYIAPIVGTILAEIWGHFFNDWICHRCVKKQGGIWRPENRHWGVWPATLMSMGGLVLYGQTLQRGLPWPGIAFGWAMNAFGLLASATVIAAYVLDIFPDHAALASSWINFWRTTGGFCVTYFELKWEARNGPGLTFGIQAATICAGSLAILLTQIFGARWRRRFPVPEAEN